MLLPSSWRLDWSKLTAAGRSEFAGWRPLAGCAARSAADAWTQIQGHLP
jgi:hypothetical protein